MFVGLAMCASVAFAQTESISRIAKASMQQDLKAPTKAVLAPVDYKASIFTKDGDYDTLRTFTFASDDMTGISYGTSAVLGANDYVNDTLTAGMAHTVILDKDVWARIQDSTWFAANYSTTYPQSSRYVGVSWILARMAIMNNPNNPVDDGFMFLTYCEQTSFAGNFNTYFSLPPVTKPANRMVEVRLTQAYVKYYDRCFIDYKIGNNWYAREINVMGVDCEVNGSASYHPVYTMPFELVNETSVELRFRGLSWRRGSDYGYLWAVDNVAIVNVNREDSWSLASAHAFDGFFGTVPQGMQIPMTYGVEAYNVGVANLNNATLSVSAGTNANNFQTVASSTPRNIPAGDIEARYNLVINERGFMQADSAMDNYMQGWLGEFANYGNTSGTLTGGYQGRSLPTTTLGANYYTLTATASNNMNSNTLTAKFDTVLYTVSDYVEQPQSGRVEGFRWGVDNGLIPSGSIFCTQFNDAGYVASDTSDNHYTIAGYRVHVRYTTGNVIPANWCFRGIEIVPQTLYDTVRMRGASIVPIVYEEVYTNDGYVSWQSVPCGIDNQAFRVSGSEANHLPTGYILPDVDYNAVTIEFLDQPALKPNTAYRFGYILNNDAYFAAAGQRTSYRNIDDTGAVVSVRYADDPATAPYATQNMISPTRWDVIVGDPAGTNSTTVYGWNIDHFPLIRPIVGEPTERPTNNIFVDCQYNTDSTGFHVRRGSDTICDDFFTVTVGSSQSVSFIPSGAHSVIDSVFLNGQLLSVYDEQTDEGELGEYEYNYEDENENVLLYRNYYTYFIESVQEGATYVFSAKTHWEPHRTGIDPVASDVILTLAPNPATTSVKLNIKGVTGMVNCNIIDMSGRVIYNANINAEGQNTIDVANFPAGAYFVRITNNTFSKIEKLIIR